MLGRGSLSVFAVFLAVLSGCTHPSENPADSGQFPNRPPYAWQTSTPAQQGLDSASIAAAIAEMNSHAWMFSLLIVRHGYLAVEQYNNNLSQYNDYEIRSASKSVTSALVGLAIKEGYIDSVGQKMMDFFPEYVTPGMDPRKFDITIEHLLTMTAGFDFNELGDYSQQFNNNTNWLKEAIDLPLKYNPGEKFAYATPMTNILSGIITRATGMSTREFAERYLFTPLNIQVRRWDQDPQGVYLGGTGMVFTARDLARFGYLYLKKGRVDSVSIVPQSWVDKSSAQHLLQNDPWPILNTVNYGYNWWTNYDSTVSMYFAAGYGGQYVFVCPNLDLVAVMTSYAYVDASLSSVQLTSALDLFVNKIVPSVVN